MSWATACDRTCSILCTRLVPVVRSLFTLTTVLTGALLADRPPSGERGGQLRASTGNTKARVAGTFRASGRDRLPRARPSLRREMSRVPASARQSQKCTRLVPAKRRNLAIAGNRTSPFAGIFLKPSDGLEPSTPSLPWRFRGGTGGPRLGTRGHVLPANRASEPCLSCPRVPGRAQADVPVSYPRRVVYLQNRQRNRTSTFSWWRRP
jgi:hypothetical protein